MSDSKLDIRTHYNSPRERADGSKRLDERTCSSMRNVPVHKHLIAENNFKVSSRLAQRKVYLSNELNRAGN